MFLRQLGLTSGKTETACAGGAYCPAVLELTDGNFVVIGEDLTATAIGRLPPGSGCGPMERVVRVPRDLMARMKSEQPAVG